mgnify:FL=1
MKAQARSLRPALSCIVRRMKAVRSRFCETGAGVAYLTLHRGLRPSIALSRPRLYGLYLLGLKSLVSVKATDTGLETLKTKRRAPASIGGLFMLVTWQSLLLPFYGVLLSGSLRAYPFTFLYGVSNLIATPAPRLETESGNYGEQKGGFNYA